MWALSKGIYRAPSRVIRLSMKDAGCFQGTADLRGPVRLEYTSNFQGINVRIQAKLAGS